MNEIRKEKLRIANLVDEINDRGTANLSFDLGTRGGINVAVWVYDDNGKLIDSHFAMGCKRDVTLLDELKAISKRLVQLHQEALAQRKQVAA
ncbi:MAG: hypothetical protein CMP20_12300 [Rickettsiales bacterium]|nr:hypothetical protein [Rickettsiales bacterium]